MKTNTNNLHSKQNAADLLIQRKPVPLVIVSILAVFLLAASAGAQMYLYSFNAVLAQQNPYPAQPGQNISIQIELQNIGFADAENVTIAAVPKSPFSLLSGQELQRTFSRVSAKSSVKVTYSLFVERNSTTGTYNFEVNVFTGADRTSYVVYKIPVYVQGTPKLVLENAQLSGAAAPGGTIKLEANISNVGTGTASQLNLALLSSSQLIPVLSRGSIFVGDLGPNQKTSAVFELFVDSSAEFATYTSNLTASYEDETGAAKTDSFSLGIPVTGTVQLEIITVSPNYNRGTIDIEMANKGTAEAKSIEAKLVIDGKPDGVEYVSSIKATKKATFSFPLQMKGTGSLQISYTGPGLEQNQVSKDIVLNFQPPSSGGDGTIAAVVIAIIAIAAYFLYKRRRKKKKGAANI